MKRWLKNSICITVLVLSLGLVVSTILYLKSNSDTAYSLSKVEVALEDTITKDETVTEGSTGEGSSSSEDPDATTENSIEEVEDGDATTTTDEIPIDGTVVDKSLDDELMHATNSGAESNEIVSTVIGKSLSVLSISNQIGTGYIVLLLVGSFFFVFSLSYLIFSKFGEKTLFDKIFKLIIFIIASKIIAVAITLGLIYVTNTYII